MPKRLFILSLLSLFVLAASLHAAVTVDFESLKGQDLLDGNGKTLARLEGEAVLAGEAHGGKAALSLRGAAEKGCVKFPGDFALDEQGTLDFWCKPEKTDGIVVGKYGAVNVSFKPGGVVYFGLKLKKHEWVACESPKDAAKPGKWLHIRASWGQAGTVLSLNDKAVAGAELPEKWEWFIADRPLILGSYDWPDGYDAWFYRGLIDDFSYLPEQKDAALKTATGKTHELRLIETPKPNYDKKVPDIVSGRVLFQGGVSAEGDVTGVAGVSVTDGFSVVKTDAGGRYSLKTSPRPSLFISRGPAAGMSWDRGINR